MGNRAAIAVGLLAGLLAGGAVVTAAVVLTPVAPAPEPSLAATPSPSPSLAATPSPSPSPSAAAPSPSSSGASSSAPSARGTAASDWEAYVPPVDYWVDKDGIIREGARRRG